MTIINSKLHYKNTKMDKENIIKTRVGGFGSSDAKMIASVGRARQLNETAKKRIAEMLGLKERKQVSTYAMEKGNAIEDIIYQSIKSKLPNAVSNPFYQSVNISERFGFGVFNHIDIEFISELTTTWWEVKATIKSPEETKREYIYQLAWHWMLLREIAGSSKLFFTHYNTSDGSEQFDAKNITQIQITYEEIKPYLEEIMEGLLIISKGLPTFVYEAEIASDGKNLPTETQQILPKINYLLRIAKESQEEADKFKEQLKSAMERSGIKSIENDYFKVTYIPEGLTVKFNSKDFQKSNPDEYKKFLKSSKVKSQLHLTLK